MTAKPEVLKVLFLKPTPPPPALNAALSSAFNITATENEKDIVTGPLKDKYDALIINGYTNAAKSIISSLQDELAVIILENQDKPDVPEKLRNRVLNVKGLSNEALIEIIKLRVENYKVKKDRDETFDRLASVGRVTNDILWDWDLRTGFLYYNSAGWMKIIGKDVHEGKITFDNWLDFVHVEDRDFVREEFNRIIANKKMQTFEVDYRMISKDGFIYVTERGYAERDDKGKAQRLLGSTQDVTGKKLAEEELRKISDVVKETAYGVFITDIDCRVTWVNKAFTGLSGYTLEEVKGRAYDFLFYRGEEFDGCSDFEKEMLKAEPFEQDLLIQRKDGPPLWIRINCQPQYDSRKKLSGYFAIIADVSAQKTAEKKLMQNEKKFRVLVQNIQDGLALMDAKGVVTEFFSGQNILGYTIDDYNSGQARVNIDPEHRDAVDCALKKVIQQPEFPSRVEFRIRKKDGEYTWVETVFYNLLNEDPIYAILANFREISESKNAEELLKQSEKKYRNLFNNNPLAMFIWDPFSLLILEANEAASIQYGYDLAELKKLTIKHLFHPEMEERVNAVVRSTRSNSNFRTSYLTRHLDKEGRVMHMEVAFHPIDYFGNRASMAIVKNITDQVELERRLAKERKLKQQEITMAAVTAQEQERLHIGRELHDNINQILATVRLYIEYALSNPAMHDQLLKSAKELVLSAVNEIRNLSKSLLPPTVGEKGLAASLDDLFNSIRKINKYSFNTSWNMDEDRLPENLKLTIFRIIQEQLSNIFKHARAKKIEASITMDNDRLILKMRDDGRGFDPAVNGKGVGLKNIRSRAELHKGAMNLRTTEGKGTELTVSFNLQL